MSRVQVTGADVLEAVALTAAALRESSPAEWSSQAAPMEADCWEVLEHLHNGLFSYALRMSPPVPWMRGRATIVWDRGGERSLPIIAERTPRAGSEVLTVMGGLIAATVDAREPHERAWHIWGVADPVVGHRERRPGRFRAARPGLVLALRAAVRRGLRPTRRRG